VYDFDPCPALRLTVGVRELAARRASRARDRAQAHHGCRRVSVRWRSGSSPRSFTKRLRGFDRQQNGVTHRCVFAGMGYGRGTTRQYVGDHQSPASYAYRRVVDISSWVPPLSECWFRITSPLDASTEIILGFPRRHEPNTPIVCGRPSYSVKCWGSKPKQLVRTILVRHLFFKKHSRIVYTHIHISTHSYEHTRPYEHF
jgi:hypothetical protein